MKKFKIVTLAAVLASTSILFTSCFGKFALTGKVYEFNKGLGNKWIQSIVLWAMLIIPVYEFAAFIDFLILNLVEFWTGSNPIAMNEGDMERQIVEKNGNKYQLTATKNNMNIVQLTGKEAGKTVDLAYNENNQTWYYKADGKEIAMFQNVQNTKGELASVNFFTSEGVKSMNAEAVAMR